VKKRKNRHCCDRQGRDKKQVEVVISEITIAVPLMFVLCYQWIKQEMLFDKYLSDKWYTQRDE
jgi:hypothetical protein